MTQKLLWSPTEERINNSNLKRFIEYVNKQHNLKIVDYPGLYEYSISQIEFFWEDILNFSEILYSGKYESVVQGEEMFGTRWFEGISLNYAENLFNKVQGEYAITSYREGYGTFRIKTQVLKSTTLKLASALRQFGIKKGDRIAAFSANIPEAVTGLLATSSLGAIWSSCSPDFGTNAVIDRFGQIEPKILFATESYEYNGKRFDCIKKIEEIVAGVPSIEKVIVLPAFQNFADQSLHLHQELPTNFIYFDDFIADCQEIEKFTQVEFAHPLYILYSSGTTGKPKCIVHGTGGTMLQHFKELSLHTDLKPSEKLFYYTTTGWMMWNWLVSGLLAGAEVVLYDGSVIYPDEKVVWEFVSKEEIEIFGTSPKFLSISEKNNVKPANLFHYNKLKAILSTGSPLTENNFEWVYNNVKSDLQLSSISGGTDIVSCFMLGSPLLPVFSGEIQCRGLGMKVEAFDSEGKSLIGGKGELVCTAPFPSMPVAFWNDAENRRYKDSYFAHFPGVWRHGDFITLNEKGGIVVHGRSDATLNPGGVRIGTAEIYRIVEELEEVNDSLVCGVDIAGEIEIFLFIVLTKGLELTPELVIKIKKSLKSKASPRHVPHRIFPVNDIPRTISGKKVEIAVSGIFSDIVPENKEALANPESLEEFAKIKLMVFNTQL
ncbi:acetoacetate--CoA ligase [Ignavibacteriales bacterium]